MKTLRPYQQAAIDATRSQLRAYPSTVVVLPTGLGKTVYAAKLVAEWEQGNCLFLAHTQELIRQAADKLGAELGYPPAVEMNVQGADPGCIWQGGMTVVGSVQTMYGDRRLAKYKDHPFGLIVVDECHHATASTYRKVIEYFRQVNPSVKVVGITATPNRADGTALGLMFESVAYQMSINDAIDGGWLVPVQQEYVVVESLSFDGIKTRANEFGEADFNAQQLEAVMTEEETLHKMAVPTVEKVGDRPTLVFTATVRHAHLLADVLNRYKPGSAKAVDGGTDKDQRKEIIREFSAGEIQFLCNCAVLTEGFDAPNCAAIVMGRPTKSLSLYTQMLGRGLRPLPGVVDGVPEAFDRRMGILTSDKPNCLVLDYVGNSEHKLASAYEVLGGNYDAESRDLARREAARQQKPVGEALEQAKALLELQRDWREREHIKAREVSYGSYRTNPFEDGPAVAGSNYTGPERGSVTDSQLRLLINLGVAEQVALRYSKRQAGAVIDSVGKTRCTAKQARTLAKYGVNPDGVGIQRAGRIIDAIAANGWRPLKEVPE
ncbi:MAG TPA: DEAD/DEAH box helicase [Gemmataceae bacterium]|nr:DEAD/DEAH box helicase [Gemmataceae bacterium]